MIDEIEVTASEFRNHAGRYLDQAAKKAVVITKHGRPSRVLIDFEHYEHLKGLDTQRAYASKEIPEAFAEDWDNPAEIPTDR